MLQVALSPNGYHALGGIQQQSTSKRSETHDDHQHPGPTETKRQQTWKMSERNSALEGGIKLEKNKPQT